VPCCYSYLCGAFIRQFLPLALIPQYIRHSTDTRTHTSPPPSWRFQVTWEQIASLFSSSSLLDCFWESSFSIRAVGSRSCMTCVDLHQSLSGWVQFHDSKMEPTIYQRCTGNQPEYVYQKETGQSEFKWMREYGSAWRVRGCMGVGVPLLRAFLVTKSHQEDRLMVADPQAFQYILLASGYNFPKSPDTSHSLRMLTGDSIGSTEGTSLMNLMTFIPEQRFQGKFTGVREKLWPRHFLCPI
jgi:hypothetical protein